MCQNSRPWLAGGCSPILSYASLLTDLPGLVVSEPLLGATERFGLLIVNTVVTNVRAVERRAVGLREDVVSFDTAAEGASAGDRLALLLASNLCLHTVEDARSLVERLGSRATHGRHLLVVEECVGILLEVLLLNEVVALRGVHAEELADGLGRNGLHFIKEALQIQI